MERIYLHNDLMILMEQMVLLIKRLFYLNNNNMSFRYNMIVQPLNRINK